MAVERLQKILSNAGVASRRVAEQMLVEGRVSVNGVVQTELGTRADPEVDEVMLDGVPILRGRYRYFMVNKPPGFVTTASDELDRETVLDLVPIGDVVLHPVGRLDMDSEGLLILTNDGHLTDLLTHPKHEVEKEYIVGLDRRLSEKDMQRMVRGIESDGERLRATSAHAAAAPPPEPGDEPAAISEWIVVTLQQGKNREIRRMVAAIGADVLTLRRIRVASLHLGTLGSGAFREITDEEVQALYTVSIREGTTVAGLGRPGRKRGR